MARPRRTAQRGGAAHRRRSRGCRACSRCWSGRRTTWTRSSPTRCAPRARRPGPAKASRCARARPHAGWSGRHACCMQLRVAAVMPACQSMRSTAPKQAASGAAPPCRDTQGCLAVAHAAGQRPCERRASGALGGSLSTAAARSGVRRRVGVPRPRCRVLCRAGCLWWLIATESI